KFFVEAKKPSRNLANNKDDYFQTVRYGWNAGTPLAVLTDFEEFIVLDCRFQPKIDDILNAKLLVFHYSDYANEDKFREIFHLFSREALSDDSLSKYAETLPKPRGKAIQKGLFPGSYISIDEAFLEELDDVRLALARSFKNNDNTLDSDELTEATQRTIDRLVFIRFLEDKLIEPHHYISEFGDRKSAWEDFISASRTLDAKYNGVVFKKHIIDSRNFVGPHDKTFSGICEDLSHKSSPYNFDAIPIHILGSIYERFLGKVVHATAKRANIEEKPEVRKAGGVYYTPQYIVNYIVDNTVGKLIKDKTPRQISKLRFADIACGSGSFLITVFDTLLNYHKKWYQENPDRAKKDGCLYLEGAWRLTLKQKQKILTNNIYGVDLDQQAVEVTQLSLYLKLLEDETTATANDTWVFFKEQLLPNLNKNIICGNSLIGTDFLEDNLFDFEEEKKIKPLDFENVFPEVMKKSGFDAIVGNPPYRMMQPHNTEQNVLDYFKEKFNIAEFKIDLFHLFIQQSIKQLRNNGLLGYITPSSLLNNVYVENLRLWILENCRIRKISLTKEKVFKDADVYTSVYIFEKEKDKNKRENHSILKTDRLELFKQNKELNYSQIKQIRYYETTGKVWNLLIDESNIGIINKMNKSGRPLQKVAQLNRGLITGNRAKFFSNSRVNDKYVPIFSGGDVHRYCTNKISEYVLFRRPKTAGGCWDSEVHLAKHKVLIRQIGLQQTATLITWPIAVTGNMFTL
ncbi:MAG: endonuclease, partial [Ignavibacteriae bacterium]